jgi:hypothetical protein
MDNNKIQKAEQPLTISMMNEMAEQSSAADGKRVSLYICHVMKQNYNEYNIEHRVFLL